MATTVTYKGATLTTVDNNTRTLKTAGSYLEDDITLVDVSGGVSITEQRDSHGGTIVTITTDGEVTPIDSPTLVVTLSWDSNFGNNGGWVPNKTYAEISAAYTAEFIGSSLAGTFVLATSLAVFFAAFSIKNCCFSLYSDTSSTKL